MAAVTIMSKVWLFSYSSYYALTLGYMVTVIMSGIRFDYYTYYWEWLQIRWVALLLGVVSGYMITFSTTRVTRLDG